MTAGIRSRLPAVRGACRTQAANAYHLAKGERIRTPPTRMFAAAPEDAEVARSLLRSGGGAAGARRRFEESFAERLGLPDAVAFTSGRAALSACLQVLGVGPSDEVVLPAYTCLVVPNSVRFCAAVPVFADIEAETLGLRADAFEAAITGATKAVVIQHLHGLVARDTEAVIRIARDRGIAVIEDCAQAIGARFAGRAVGALGDAACFSTGNGKVLDVGCGGLATARDPARGAALRDLQRSLAEPGPAEIRARLATYVVDYARHAAPRREWSGPLQELRHGHLRVPAATPEELDGRRPPGYIRPMPDALAALAQLQLDRLDEVADARRENAARWDRWCRSRGLETLRVIPGSMPAFPVFPAIVPHEMKRHPRWAYEQAGVRLSTWFESPPCGVDESEVPIAAGAYGGCVSFPTSEGPE